LRCLRFISRIKAVALFAAEIHILAASAGALAHRAMMHMTHMMHVVAVVMQPDTLGQTFRSRLRAWDQERRGFRQWRKRDGNSES
jgi:hypothetical protein